MCQPIARECLTEYSKEVDYELISSRRNEAEELIREPGTAVVVKAVRSNGTTVFFPAITTTTDAFEKFGLAGADATEGEVCMRYLHSYQYGRHPISDVFLFQGFDPMELHVSRYYQVRIAARRAGTWIDRKLLPERWSMREVFGARAAHMDEYILVKKAAIRVEDTGNSDTDGVEIVKFVTKKRRRS